VNQPIFNIPKFPVKGAGKLDVKKKYRSFQRMDIWPQYAIIDIFDLNVRNFPSERHEELLEVHKLFESCFEKIDKNI